MKKTSKVPTKKGPLPPPTLIGAYEARTHWSDIMRRLRQGEAFNLSWRGDVIGALMPRPESRQRQSQREQAQWQEWQSKVRGIRARAKPLTKGMTTKALIDEGRRT